MRDDPVMNLRQAFALGPVVAILRGIEPGQVRAIAEVLIQAGVRAIEIPLNSPDPLVGIALLAEHADGRAVVGAGTVLDPADVQRCVDAGARFIVSPHFDPAVVGAVSGVEYLPGVATPSEAMAAHRAGCGHVKVFPADVVTSRGINAWRAVMPGGLALVAVSGVDASNAIEYLDAGAIAIGVGSALYRPGDGADLVADRARALFGVLDRYRSGG